MNCWRDPEKVVADMHLINNLCHDIALERDRPDQSQSVEERRTNEDGAQSRLLMA
jgi:hypothetical protein